MGHVGKGTLKRLEKILSLHDFEVAAKRRLPRPLFGYIAGAAEDNRSLDANRAAFNDYQFLPRALVDVSRRSQHTVLFGKCYTSPFGIAPVGISALSAYQGDLILAQAAHDANIPAIMSGSSLMPMEQIAEAAPGTWFQAYLPADQGRIDCLVDRIARAGFETLVITCDIPVWANRENNIRAGFATPLRPSLRLAWDGLIRPRWLLGTFARTLLTSGMPHFENSFATRGAPIVSSTAIRDTTGRDHLNWENIARIRRRWSGPLVLKGILHPEDAERARGLGADGIIVSNHGGRQLDGAAAPLRALPRILDAAGELPVMMDGGIRRGTDVLKAMALGAKAVFAGRPFMYAAAAEGGAGIERGIQLLRDEVDRNMALLGINRLSELDESFLLPTHPDERPARHPSAWLDTWPARERRRA
ncbi:MAG TPA: alpha-hydroxy acid oxidase [Noviherbaspirillum sp.]|jgi:L-lactate dehydrogenase (cytochrome)|uniref:alpha-hydroxy acid oxidase n=1 Tax=Noviherbaspirillum sp. TaxID=1926288 RepID=UPI002DDDA818|nr:alpha-hydroxy acid oxidase [Noviherbaspirillum sp.]HEV2611509.1 alpha-hydroxy acid oxidase [Noviherbaspirillum sp.]